MMAPFIPRQRGTNEANASFQGSSLEHNDSDGPHANPIVGEAGSEEDTTLNETASDSVTVAVGGEPEVANLQVPHGDDPFYIYVSGSLITMIDRGGQYEMRTATLPANTVPAPGALGRYSCEGCRVSFNSEVELIIHLLRSDEPTEASNGVAAHVACPLCFEEFIGTDREERRYNHLKENHGNEVSEIQPTATGSGAALPTSDSSSPGLSTIEGLAEVSEGGDDDDGDDGDYRRNRSTRAPYLSDTSSEDFGGIFLDQGEDLYGERERMRQRCTDFSIGNYDTPRRSYLIDPFEGVACACASGSCPIHGDGTWEERREAERQYRWSIWGTH